MELRKPRDFGMVFNDTFAFVRENFKPLLKNLVFIALPGLLIGAILMTWAIGDFLTSIFTLMPMVINQSEPSPQQMIALFSSLFSWKLLLGFVGSMIGALMLYGVGLIFVRNYSRGLSLEPSAIWSGIQSELGTLFTTSFGGGILMMLFVMITALVNVIPCLGQIAWFVLLLFAASLMMLIYPLRMEEQGSLFDAISRGRALLKGFWWQNVALLLLMGLIVVLMAGVVNFLPNFYMQMQISPENAVDPVGLMNSLKGIFSVIIILSQLSSLFYVLIMIAFYLQYFNLVERKEGAGLQGRIDSIQDVKY